MPDKLVVALIVIITIAGHVWIFRWVKFKMDEGIILKFLKDNKDPDYHSTEAISSNTKIKIKRVSIVSNKSKNIIKHPSEKSSWYIN